jgi:Ser/Thr protein kinase RdoA (MazF antagonist)
MHDYKNNTSFLEAVEAFGFIDENSEITPINSGLINSTYKISDSTRSIILQKINKTVFLNPADIIHNYSQIYNYLTSVNDFKIPAMVKTIDGESCLIDSEKNYWRATEFISNTFTPETANNSKDAFDAAFCFGKFSKSLAGLEADKLKVIIPQFHDLEYRYCQFTEALEKGNAIRKEKSKTEIEQLVSRNKLVDFYKKTKTDPHFKLRIMHHDAKLSNILFDNKTKEVVCPVDLDTTQPGYFFSDIGDMIRSMTCNHSENSTEFNSISIQEDFYREIMKGYLLAMNDEFTDDEKTNIHYAGLLMIYMQALRYMTDHLNGDIYYKINYPGQNFDRAINQLILLQKLEEFLVKEYKFIA